MLLKMKFLTDPPKTFELIETLLWERDGASGWRNVILRDLRRRRDTSHSNSMRPRRGLR